LERAKVAIVRYRNSYSSLKETVELCDGFSRAGIDLKGGSLEEFSEEFYRVDSE